MIIGQTCWGTQIGHKRLDFGIDFNQGMKSQDMHLLNPFKSPATLRFGHLVFVCLVVKYILFSNVEPIFQKFIQQFIRRVIVLTKIYTMEKGY
jgi:hypothetical protein